MVESPSMGTAAETSTRLGDKPSKVTESEDNPRLSSSVETQTLQDDPDQEFPLLTTFQQIALVFFLTLSMVLNITQAQAVLLSLDAMGGDLDIKIVDYQWLTSAYSLAFGAVLLIFGRLADIYGAKLIFLSGMGFFSVFTIACAFSQTQIQMFLFRAFQGIGIGAAVPSALGILGRSFPPGQNKSTAFSTFSAGAPVGGGVGCVLGGFMTQYAPNSWRMTFIVSTALAWIVMAGAWKFVPRDPPRNRSLTVDWIGGALITTGLTLFTFALADGSGVGWRTPYIPVFFVVGLGLLIAFWFWERHLEYNTDREPLMLTSLWYKERFACVQLIGALAWSSFNSFLFFSVEWFQNLQGLNAIQSTIRFIPTPVTGLILNAIVAVVASRIDAQWLICIGCIGTGLAPLLYAIQPLHASYFQYQFNAMWLCVLGADFIFACSILYVSKVAGPGQQALAGGLFNMSTQVGTAFGLAIQTIIQSRVVEREVTQLGLVYDVNSKSTPLIAVEKGLRAAFWGSASFSFAALVVAVTCLWRIGKVGTKTKKSRASAKDGKVEGGEEM